MCVCAGGGAGLATQTEKPHMKSNLTTLESPPFLFCLLFFLQMRFGWNREGLDSRRFSRLEGLNRIFVFASAGFSVSA